MNLKEKKKSNKLKKIRKYDFKSKINCAKKVV